MKIWWIVMGILLSQGVLAPSTFAASASSDPINPRGRSRWSFLDFRLIPTQSGGRIKPLDSFARETVLFETGSASFKGWDPVDLLVSWIVFPQEWETEPFIQVTRIDVRRQLNLDEKRTRFSPSELFRNPVLLQYAERMDRGEEGSRPPSVRGTAKADARDQEVRRVLERAGLFRDLVTGSAWRLIPKTQGTPWESLAGNSSEGGVIREQFAEVLRGFQSGNREQFERFSRLVRASVEGEISGWNPEQARKLAAETLYNRSRPFQISWIFYLIAALLWMVPDQKWLRKIAGGLTVLAFLIHVYGFALRCYIAGRPPVTNMYESIVWVMLGVVVFAGILYRMQRQIIPLTVACIVATIGLISADAAPAMMDPGIHPLVPVLRSNYWLTIHVLTITLGYAALALTFGLSNVTLFHFARKTQGYLLKVSNLNQLTYRAMQFGVVLLAAGTILGGVWADYSWGRFWGWDPKETWALIALLCYLAILHGRYTQWVGQFAYASWTVVGFLSVLMAWYGVNFILGVGLHSYGFSSGGFTGVAIFVALQAIYVGITTYFYKQRRVTKAEGSPLPGEDKMTSVHH